MSEWLTLDVGGTTFRTLRSTLQADGESMIGRMLDDSFWEQSEDGVVRIDADPEYFRVILNYLRTGSIIIPESTPKSGVLATAKYLQVEGIISYFERCEQRSRRQVIYSWGSGSAGELGTWAHEDSPTPVEVKVVPFTDSVKHVALGANYSCVLTESGAVYVFGLGDWCQLGLPSASTVLTPTPLPLDNVECIATGYAYAMGVTSDHKVYFWGNNNHGQSGLGPPLNTRDRKIERPTLLESLCDKRIKQVSCGSFFVLALGEDGRVWSWGLIECLGLGSVDEVKTRYPHEVADSYSKDKRPILLTPHCVERLSSEKITKVAAGQWHSCSITATGTVYSWGIGYQGRLGHGDKANYNYPSLVKGALEDTVIVDVSCGSFHTVALTKCGKVYCWGDNANGQCGLAGSDDSILTEPTRVMSLTLLGGGLARSISTGRQHTSVVMCGPHIHQIPTSPNISDHGQVYNFGESKAYSSAGASATSSASVPKSASPMSTSHSGALSPTHASPPSHLPRLVRGMERVNVHTVTSGLHHNMAIADTIPP